MGFLKHMIVDYLKSGVGRASIIHDFFKTCLSKCFEHGSVDTRRRADPVPHLGSRLLRKGLRIGPQS